MRTLRLPEHYDFGGTLGPLAKGRDPSVRISATELWWACRTPAGPATLHLRRAGDAMQANGFGPGAEWVVEQADAIVGLRDDVSGFDALARTDPVVREAWRRRPGLRMTRTGRLFRHLLSTILEQKVTGMGRSARTAGSSAASASPRPARSPISCCRPTPR